MSVATVIVYILLAISGFFAVVGSIGIIRMPNVYNRIHAETLCVFGGTIVGLVAIAIFQGWSTFSLKAIMIALFLFFTSPVGSHALAKAAHESGEDLSSDASVDKLEEAK